MTQENIIKIFELTASKMQCPSLSTWIAYAHIQSEEAGQNLS